jgi:aspartate/methionine/tyrosine aminotransferase
MVEEFRKRRDFVCRRIGEMKKVSCRVPGGAFYVFLNIRETGMNAEDFTRFLLHEAHVAVVPGTAFGAHGEGYVRISYAASLENLEKAMDRMENALRSL